MRFERGISPGLTIPALKRATQLIAELGGGEAARGIVDVYPGRVEPEPVTVSVGEVKRVLGVEFSREQIEAALASLGFEVRSGTSESEVVTVAPYWRTDISLPVDLVEEVARVIGYDQIPTTMIRASIPQHDPAPIVALKRKLGQHLVGCGFQEIVSYPWASQESLRKLRPQAQAQPAAAAVLRLVNPMTIDQTCLRPNLRVSLISALAANRAFVEGGIRLYELGRAFLPRRNDLPDEIETLCAVLGGPRHASSWLGEAEPGNFFDAKGVVEGLLARLGVAAGFELSRDQSLHPVDQAAIIADGTRLGIIGQLHPAVQAAFEAPEPAYLFEISVPALLPFTVNRRMFEPASRFPAVVRDMALVVDATTPNQRVVDVISGLPLVVQVALFDVYSGEQVPPGQKSLAYRVNYQSPDHTLTDEEVNSVQEQILGKLSREFGAVLRT